MTFWEKQFNTTTLAKNILSIPGNQLTSKESASNVWKCYLIDFSDVLL